MRSSIRTLSRTLEQGRRRRKKTPSPETELRVEWLTWLVETYGAEAVAEWQECPVTYEEWRKERSLRAHEAA